MGQFSDTVKRFAARVTVDTQAVFVGTVADAKSSIQHGSTITGAPGQPVDEGGLIVSFQVEFTSPTSARISTNLPYAESNEDGIARPGGGPYIQRSPVGGRHSIAKTIDGLPLIVDDNVKRLTGGT